MKILVFLAFNIINVAMMVSAIVGNVAMTVYFAVWLIVILLETRDARPS